MMLTGKDFITEVHCTSMTISVMLRATAVVFTLWLVPLGAQAAAAEGTNKVSPYLPVYYYHYYYYIFILTLQYMMWAPATTHALCPALPYLSLGPTL